MILDLIYGYSKPLEKASYCSKSKGRKEESIGRVFKKLILVKSSYTRDNYFEITFMFSAQGLLVGNGTSVTCLRKSREPITALKLATYVTPLMVRNFWLCSGWQNRMEQKLKTTVWHCTQGMLPKRLGGGVQTTSRNYYPIYDKSLQFLPPYLWPGQKFDALFMTFAVGAVSLNIINVGLLVVVFLIIMNR